MEELFFKIITLCTLTAGVERMKRKWYSDFRVQSRLNPNSLSMSLFPKSWTSSCACLENDFLHFYDRQIASRWIHTYWSINSGPKKNQWLTNWTTTKCWFVFHWLETGAGDGGHGGGGGGGINWLPLHDRTRILNFVLNGDFSFSSVFWVEVSISFFCVSRLCPTFWSFITKVKQ